MTGAARDRYGRQIEPPLDPPDDDEPDYADMDDDQRIAERECQPARELAQSIVEIERDLERAEAILRRHGLLHELHQTAASPTRFQTRSNECPTKA